jgi:hypothetical protein
LLHGASTAFLTSSESDAMSGADYISNHYDWARRPFNEMELCSSAGLLSGEIATRRIVNRQSKEEVRYGVYGYQSECMGR